MNLQSESYYSHDSTEELYVVVAWEPLGGEGSSVSSDEAPVGKMPKNATAMTMTCASWTLTEASPRFLFEISAVAEFGVDEPA